MSPKPVVVRLRAGSDGDATHVPPPGAYTQVDPACLYLEKTAQQWMERRGDALPGVKYILETLPAGYTMWQRPRPGNKTHIDSYLYGHPDGKKFNSPNRFYPHFEHLMNNAGSSTGCLCTPCAGSAGMLPKSASNTSRKTTSTISSSSRPATPKEPASRTSQQFTAVHGQPLIPVVQAVRGRSKATSACYDTSYVDEEGSPDVYRHLINKLRRHGKLDEKIEEPLSPDWRAEIEILPILLQELRKTEQWKPRRGEIVLFVRDLPENTSIAQVERTGVYELYNEDTNEFVGIPKWEAGLVGQIPTQAPETSENVIYAGVRVEPLPSPNDTNKSLSNHHKYVPLRQTRPFVLWEHFLGSTPKNEWHPTIENALTVSSTLSLVGKHRFRGTWPNASVYCHALYLGHELLAVGDTVRFLPSAAELQAKTCDVMVIRSIRIKWSNLDKASNNDYDEGRPYNSEIFIYGTAFASDASRSDKQWVSGSTDGQGLKAAAAYSNWHPLHPRSKELAIPHSRCIGRLYERKAMSAFLGSEHLPGLEVGIKGLLQARKFSTRHDQRLVNDAATWFWGDNRGDSLGLHTINGLDTAQHDQLRDIKDLRKKIKVLEAEKPVASSSKKRPTVNASSSRGLRNFMARELPPRPGRTVAIRSGSSSVASSFASEDAVMAGQKRTHAEITSDDTAEDDNDEVRRSTVIVEGFPVARKRKQTVQVVIDD